MRAGRMEEVLPGVLYVDGAHNTSAVRGVCSDSVTKAGLQMRFCFSAVREKDYEEMIQYISASIQRRRLLYGDSRLIDATGGRGRTVLRE